MKKNTPVAWFEIVVKDMPRAVQFYEAVFQVQLEMVDMPDLQMAMFPYQEGFPSGALAKGDMYQNCQEGAGTTIVYLATEAVEVTLERIVKSGGTVLMPSTSIGENGFIGMFTDSENNTVGLWSEVA